MTLLQWSRTSFIGDGNGGDARAPHSPVCKAMRDGCVGTRVILSLSPIILHPSLQVYLALPEPNPWWEWKVDCPLPQVTVALALARAHMPL